MKCTADLTGILLEPESNLENELIRKWHNEAVTKGGSCSSYGGNSPHGAGGFLNGLYTLRLNFESFE